MSHYLPATPAAYGRFCSSVEVRPVKLLRPDLSPARMFADLFGVADVDIVSRPAAWAMREALAPAAEAAPPAARARRRKEPRRWDVPTLPVTLVGHFLRADFGRIFGRKFWEDLGSPHPADPGFVRVRSRRLIQFVEYRGRHTATAPALEYLWRGGDLYQVTVSLRDTGLPYGPAKLQSLAEAFLGVGKCDCLSDEEKGRMLRTFCERTADAYGYAMADAVLTLLLYEQMVSRDAGVYRSFGFGGADVPPLRPSLGSRVSTFVLRTAERARGVSHALHSRRALEGLMRQGSMALFADHPDASRFGDQTGRTHGGLLYSRSPTRPWHEAPGMLRDVDMSGCYGQIVARLPVYYGRPVIFEPGAREMTLREAVGFVQGHADWDGWMVRASGPITAAPNALVPSTDDAVTSLNYRAKRRKGRRAPQRAFHLEALRDPASVKATGGCRLYSGVVESGVVTSATWLMIQALPGPLRRQYEGLRADSVVFYPSKLAAADGRAFDALRERYQSEAIPWAEELSLEAMEQVRRTRIDGEYVTLRYSLHEYAARISEFRAQARRAGGKGSALDLAWKVHINSPYGVLACPQLPVSNFVAANLVTAWARAGAFALGQALNAIQTITDGCTYRLDQVPACTYEECLRIRPDYSIRRAEEGDGISFVDPKTIPQDDAGFTIWYREHAKRFFGVSGSDYDALFGTHDLEHKRTSFSKSVAFDGLACDGAANYAKCTRTPEGEWRVEDFAARSFRQASRRVLGPWLVGAYSADNLTGLAPLAEDGELLSFRRAAQRARKNRES